MSDESNIELIFGLDDPELEDEQRLKFAQKLLPELRNLDEVEKAYRTEDQTSEAGSKPGFATVIGSITALVQVKNIKAFLGFLGDRLQDKPIKGSIKVGNNQVAFEVKSRQELAECNLLPVTNVTSSFRYSLHFHYSLIHGRNQIQG